MKSDPGLRAPKRADVIRTHDQLRFKIALAAMPFALGGMFKKLTVPILPHQ